MFQFKKMPKKTEKKGKEATLGNGAKGKENKAGNKNREGAAGQTTENPGIQEGHSREEDPGYVPSEETQFIMGVIRDQAERVIDDKLVDGKAESILLKLIKEEMSALEKKFTSQHEITNLEMKSEIKKLQQTIESLETDTIKMKRKIERLEFVNAQKDTKIKDLELQLDYLEQKEYDHSLQIVGVPEGKGHADDVKQIVKIGKELGMKIKSNDTAHITRLGRRRNRKQDISSSNLETSQQEKRCLTTERS